MPRKRDIINKLKKAREYVAAGWTRNVYFKPADIVTGAPTCYCAIGGINMAVSGGPCNSDLYPKVYDIAEATMHKLATAINGVVGNQRDAWHIISQYNDSHTHAEVVAMFDKAIAA